MQKRKLTVFISYKREDAIHDGWVERFATDLRGAGIDAVLDIWEVRLGESFTDYMALRINDADAVLFIITRASVAAVESPHHGALKFELQMANARLISGELFRLIGIYREGPNPPIHIRDNRYADFRDDSKYAEALTTLVADLLGKTGPPPLTTRVSLLHRDLAEIEALLPRYPNHASLMSAYLNMVEREGTRDQITLAMERARVWLLEHPDDTYVGRFYMGLVERHGTADQVAEMLNHFGSWLRTSEHADNASIRSGFLGVVARCTLVTDEQVSTILEDTRDWLRDTPNDLHGRGAYLSLAGRRGTDRQFADALSDITSWLADPKHADDTHVRLTYLGIVRRRGNEPQRIRALAHTKVWLAAHPEDIAVRQAYRALKSGSRRKKSREKGH